jgi:hypothetical protein
VPDATTGIEVRTGLDTRPVDAAVPDAREAGAEALLSLPDAPVDATRIDQASSPDVPYGLDGQLADAGVRDADLTDAPPGCIERPGVSCRMCNAVAPGAPIAFDVTDSIGQLIADPSACLVYGFGAASASRIVVFDAAQKSVLTRVELGAEATGISLSPSGTFLVASLYGESAIAVVDKSNWTISLVNTVMAPISVAVDDRGLAYYTSEAWFSLRRIDLTLGTASDAEFSTGGNNLSKVALSPDGTRLYWADNRLSYIRLLDVTSATPPVLSQVSNVFWVSGARYVSPSQKHVYCDSHQFDASNVGRVKGSVSGAYAEDSQARFVVTRDGILDAQTLTTLVSKPYDIQAAAFISADTELWTYDQLTAKITCTNVADLSAGKTLGLREGVASAIRDYEFSRLVADPVRPRLYGLDAKKRQVVSIDRATGTALRTVLVGSTPTELEIDASGSFLYVGHKDTFAIAQIDAESLSFVRFIETPRESFELVSLGSGRIASNDYAVLTKPILMDVASGAVLDTLSPSTGIYEGALFATADGNALFVGESGGTNNAHITRYDVSGGTFVRGTSSDSGSGSGYSSPPRRVVGSPDGSSIYYDRYCLDGTNLQTQRYAVQDTILSVTPNGKLATSALQVYRVSDGTKLDTWTAYCAVQAVAPDSSAVYCAIPGPGRIISFSLAGLQ